MCVGLANEAVQSFKELDVHLCHRHTQYRLSQHQTQFHTTNMKERLHTKGHTIHERDVNTCYYLYVVMSVQSDCTG